MNSECQALVPMNSPGDVELLRAVPARRGRPRKVVATVDIVDAVAAAARRKPQVEDETQKYAFQVYFDLGNDRSLQAVADKTKVKLSKVSEWSQRFKWLDRIKRLSESGPVSRIQAMRGKYLEQRWKECFIVDPIEQKKLMVDPKLTASKTKDLDQATSRYIHDTLAVEEQNRDGDGNGRGGKGGIMVNVIIKK